MGFFFIYILKGDGRGRGLIFLGLNSLWGVWLEVSIFKIKGTHGP